MQKPLRGTSLLGVGSRPALLYSILLLAAGFAGVAAPLELPTLRH